MTNRERDIDLAWAGGLLDGEECITIQFTPASSRADLKNDQYRAVVKITMGCRLTIERVCAIVGCGKVYAHPGGQRTNSHFDWLCQARQAEQAIRVLRPYLFTKAQEADVLLEFCDLSNAPQGGKGGTKEVPEELQRRRQELYQRIRHLKPRSRFYSEKDRYLNLWDFSIHS